MFDQGDTSPPPMCSHMICDNVSRAPSNYMYTLCFVHDERRRARGSRGSRFAGGGRGTAGTSAPGTSWHQRAQLRCSLARRLAKWSTHSRDRDQHFVAATHNTPSQHEPLAFAEFCLGLNEFASASVWRFRPNVSRLPKTASRRRGRGRGDGDERRMMRVYALCLAVGIPCFADDKSPERGGAASAAALSRTPRENATRFVGERESCCRIARRRVGGASAVDASSPDIWPRFSFSAGLLISVHWSLGSTGAG